jgi:hypothetical protein
MKLSQAIDIYVRRKRDAGAQFNAPAKQLRSSFDTVAISICT